MGRLVGRLQLAAIVSLRARLVFLLRRSLAVNLRCRGVALSKGEGEYRNPRTENVPGHSEDSEILAAGFLARLRAVHHDQRDWRQPDGCELRGGHSRMADAF